MLRLLLGLVLLAVASAAAASDYKRAPGPYTVDTLSGAWRDNERAREIPFRIHHAPGATGARPVVLFSHGLGGSRDGGAYLGRHLASYGYVAVHLQHPGSDASLWESQERPGRALLAWSRDPARVRAAAEQRFRDVGSALDALSVMAAHDPVLAGRLDLSRVGMSGHSFGAHTTLAAAGQYHGRPGETRSFREPRIRAAIAYSPAPPRYRRDLALVYRDIRIPVLHMTGTADGDPLNRGMSPEDRQIPFREIRGSDQMLLVLTGGDHSLFGGRVRGEARPDDARHLDLIRMGSIAFWDAYLLDDRAARDWLTQGGFAAAVGGSGTVSVRLR